MMKNKSNGYVVNKKTNSAGYSAESYKKLPKEDGNGEFPSLYDVNKIREKKQKLKYDIINHRIISELGAVPQCNDKDCEICEGSGEPSKDAFDRYKELKEQQYSGKKL